MASNLHFCMGISQSTQNVDEIKAISSSKLYQFGVQCKLNNKFVQWIVPHSTQLHAFTIFDLSWNDVDISVLGWCMCVVNSVHMLTWDPFHIPRYDGRAISLSLLVSLQWRHDGRDSVSNQQPRDCLLNRLFKENIKAPRHWPFCEEFTGTGEFPAHMASYVENVSIWWRQHVLHTT